MLYTQEAVQANIRNKEGKRVFYLDKGDRLTPGARDYLTRERIPILPAQQARPQRYRLPGGGYLEEKPEHMTHLNGDMLVSKLHPRIALRGALDTLEAELILAQQALDPPYRDELGEILSLAREIMRCDVLEQPLELTTLCCLTQEEQRSHSHRPQDYYGQPHFMPDFSDGPGIAWLNRARCAARETERYAIAAYQDRDGVPTREDIPRALNRMSSMLYILMIRLKASKKIGKSP